MFFKDGLQAVDIHPFRYYWTILYRFYRKLTDGCICIVSGQTSWEQPWLARSFYIFACRWVCRHRSAPSGCTDKLKCVQQLPQKNKINYNSQRTLKTHPHHNLSTQQKHTTQKWKSTEMAKNKHKIDSRTYARPTYVSSFTFGYAVYVHTLCTPFVMQYNAIIIYIYGPNKSVVYYIIVCSLAHVSGLYYSSI